MADVLALILTTVFVKVFQAFRKVQESCLQQIIPVVWSSAPATACAGACLILVPVVGFVYCFGFFVQMKELGMVIVCGLIVCFSAQLFWTGAVESRNNVLQVSMVKVQLTLTGDELNKLEKAEYATVKIVKGQSLKPFIEQNQKFAKKFGPGHIIRASPTRAVPVLADLEHPGERFWAIENSPVVRYSLLGYTDVRIRLTSPGTACPQIAEAMNRWQDLRLLAASNKYREVAKKLRSFEVALEYPSVEMEGHSRNLQLRFRVQASSQARLGPLQQKDKLYDIDEVEESVASWIEMAHRAHEKRQALKEMVSPLNPLPISPPKEPQVERQVLKDDVQSSCQQEQKQLPSPICIKGHPMKKYRKLVTAKCDTCSATIRKGRWCMACIHNVSCRWYMCHRCAPLANDTDEDVLCVCCLDASATMVMQACGHLVLCVACSRSFVSMSSGIAIKKMEKKHFLKTKVSCPVCRQDSVVVDRENYKDVIYTP